MNSFIRRSGIDLPEPVRRFFEGEWDTGVRVEEYTEGSSYVVRAELPGIDPERDVDVTVTGDQLEIKARREERSEHKGKDSYRSEFRYGSFSRHITLPHGVHQDDVRASYADGVLEVRVSMPDQPAAGSRKIPVSRGGTGETGAGTGPTI